MLISPFFLLMKVVIIGTVNIGKQFFSYAVEQFWMSIWILNAICQQWLLSNICIQSIKSNLSKCNCVKAVKSKQQWQCQNGPKRLWLSIHYHNGNDNKVSNTKKMHFETDCLCRHNHWYNYNFCVWPFPERGCVSIEGLLWLRIG